MRRIVMIVILCSALLGQVETHGNGSSSDFTELHDTVYNTLVVARRGPIVELRGKARQTEAIESAVDLRDTLRLVVPYTRTLYGALFLKPSPSKVLMVGLGGAGFHRLFVAAFPEATLHTVELDPKVLELSKKYMGFEPARNTPVTLMDGRMFIKRTEMRWDWLILDAYRGGYVPPHLKTEEFYRECAMRLSDDGVLVVNLHSSTQLYYSDLKTLRGVFPQILLFSTAGGRNVVAMAVKYHTPDITDSSRWPSETVLHRKIFDGRLDLKALRSEVTEFPLHRASIAKTLTDDFAPVEFLDTIKRHNTN